MDDNLLFTALFSKNLSEKESAQSQIYSKAIDNGIILSSIQNLYQAFGRDEREEFTVPAMNIRTLTYDSAQIIFDLAKKHDAGAFVFELARTEQQYTNQPPREYVCAVLAGALKVGYKGPVFIQGDHYQFKTDVFRQSPEKEIERIKKAIDESIAAGFYNIDIDVSTLVDLEKENLTDQQKDNFEMTALLTEYIRSLQPKNIVISIGGEIGHIGGKNSTPADFEAFMKGYLDLIGKGTEGISKVSVQTGTSHGGVPLADGTMAKIDIDFSVLKDISVIAREKYHIGGAVQHGASTLPNELFGKFPENKTLEIHLATGFQNIVYDNLPDNLINEMYTWIKKDLKSEWDTGWSEKQFIYKCRKKALGPFKEKIWTLPADQKRPILEALRKQFEFLFRELRVFNTKNLIDQYVQ